ncbi:MAG: alpha/beta hydrolase [Pseudomonadota bacterium]
MTDKPVTYISIGEGDRQRRIATLQHTPDASAHPRPAPYDSTPAPGLVWLPGFKSEMTSTKATALQAYADANGLVLTRFDYSGHGQSDGAFEDGTISAWLEETLAVLAQRTTGPQILVGSSMGGWLALLALRHALATGSTTGQVANIRALVLIAPAWDMTQTLMWDAFPAAVKAQVEREGRFERPSAYDDGPYVITRTLIEDGAKHLIADAPFDPGCPVLILHGLIDPDVPWEHSMELESLLEGDRVRIAMVPDGEHRLSRDEDLAQLFSLIEDATRESADNA